MTDLTIMTYQVRMASGETFRWTGDPVAGTNWKTAAGFLILPEGTLVSLAQVESMTPIGGAA